MIDPSQATVNNLLAKGWLVLVTFCFMINYFERKERKLMNHFASGSNNRVKIANYH